MYFNFSKPSNVVLTLLIYHFFFYNIVKIYLKTNLFNVNKNVINIYI